MTHSEELFREGSTLRECAARLLRIVERGLLLDRTVFYPLGGGLTGVQMGRGLIARLNCQGRAWLCGVSRRLNALFFGDHSFRRGRSRSNRVN